MMQMYNDALLSLDADLFASVNGSIAQELTSPNSLDVDGQQFSSQSDNMTLNQPRDKMTLNQHHIYKLINLWREKQKLNQLHLLRPGATNPPARNGMLDARDHGDVEPRNEAPLHTASQLSHDGLVTASELGIASNTRTSPSLTEAPAPAARGWIIGVSSSAEVGRVSPPPAKSNTPGVAKPKIAKSDRLPSPEFSPFRGDYDFHTEPPEDELVSGRNISRSAHWTFDSSQRTLFIKPAKMFPLRVHIGRDLPMGAFLHVMFAFEEPEHCFEPVVRCANHRQTYANTAFGRHESHFGLTDSSNATHKIDAKGHPVIIVPYSDKGQGVHSEVFQFTCFSSSCMPFKKKTLKMICCLYINGQVYGRDVVYLRVCACPGRDRIHLNQKQHLTGEGERRKRAHSEVDPHDDSTPYCIKRTVHGWKNFMLVQKMIDNMESLEFLGEPFLSPGRNDGSPTSATSSDD